MQKPLVLFLCIVLLLLSCQKSNTEITKIEDTTVFSDQEKRELTEMLHKFDKVVCRASSKSKISACYKEFITSIVNERKKENFLPFINDFTQEEREEILSSLSPSLRNEIWEPISGEIKRRVEGSKSTFKDSIHTVVFKFEKYREFLDSDLSKSNPRIKKYVERHNMDGHHFNPFYLSNHMDELDFNNEQLRLSITMQFLTYYQYQIDSEKSADEFYDGIKKAFEDRRRKQQEEVKQ